MDPQEASAPSDACARFAARILRAGIAVEAVAGHGCAAFLDTLVQAGRLDLEAIAVDQLTDPYIDLPVEQFAEPVTDDAFLAELLDCLLPYLTDADPVIRDAAAAAATGLAYRPLPPSRGAGLCAALAAHARPLDTDRRAAVALAIGDLGGAPRGFLDDPWFAVRVCAALAPALAEDPAALAVLTSALDQPRMLDVAFDREPRGCARWPRVALIEAACRRLRDHRPLMTGARTVVDTCSGWTVGRHTVAPFARRFFPDGWPSPAKSTPEQRAFIAAVAARDQLWQPSPDGDAADVLEELGLPTERAEWEGLLAAHRGDDVYIADDIIVLEHPSTIVLNRPLMWIGADRGDPALPDAVVALVRAELQEALDAGRIRSFSVTVEGARAFTVEVRGTGLGVEPGRRGQPSELEWTVCGDPAACVWRALTVAAAVAKKVHASTCLDGTVYAQDFAFARPLGPLCVLGPSDRSSRKGLPDGDGFRLAYVLDELWLAEDAKLSPL